MTRAIALLACLAGLAAGCRRTAEAPPPSPSAQATAPTNRVDVPSSVRQNLGITFAKVEKRAVGRTLRVPGSFEALPTGRQEHRAPAPGRVHLLVDPAATVQAGTPLFRLDSPRLRELQEQLAQAIAAESLARAGIESMGPLRGAHETHKDNLRTAESMWAARVASLEELRAAGAGTGEPMAAAWAALAAARADLSEAHEKGAELEAQEARLRAEQQASAVRVELTLSSLASLTGLAPEDLLGSAGPGEPPAWRTLATVEVRATAPGAIESIAVSNGSWVEDAAPVLTVVDPAKVLFRAHAPQSDLERLHPGMRARVVPPRGGGSESSAGVSGTLSIAPIADRQQRSIDLLVTLGEPVPWARAGVSAFLEVTPAATGDLPLTVPVQAIARDGLASVVFRRDPKDPDKVIRLEADLGPDDGRYAVINSGVREGDEVVLDGVYQLMAATSGTAQKGGHFHADGTFHEGDD